jgi:hypothetical protein
VVGRLPGQFEIQIAPLTAKFLYFVTVKTSAKIGDNWKIKIGQEKVSGLQQRILVRSQV